MQLTFEYGEQSWNFVHIFQLDQNERTYPCCFAWKKIVSHELTEANSESVIVVVGFKDGFIFNKYRRKRGVYVNCDLLGNNA